MCSPNETTDLGASLGSKEHVNTSLVHFTSKSIHKFDLFAVISSILNCDGTSGRIKGGHGRYVRAFKSSQEA
jgi:hypothetical protein